MAQWLMEIDLRHIWRNEELTFSARKDAIVQIFRAHDWHSFPGVSDIVDAIEAADDVKAFDAAWSLMYDMADEDRVWVRLHRW